MGCGLLSHIHASENVTLLGHSTEQHSLVPVLSITAQRSRMERLPAITALWSSPFPLCRTVPPVELRHFGQQWSCREIQISLEKQRNLSGKGTSVTFNKEKKIKHWEMYKWMQCRGRGKLNETSADLGRSDVPLGLWSLFFFPKCQDWRRTCKTVNRTGL